VVPSITAAFDSNDDVLRTSCSARSRFYRAVRSFVRATRRSTPGSWLLSA
jgi:hypothetical protein